MYIKIESFIFLSIILLAIVGCNSEEANYKNVFRYNESKGVSTLDPVYARSQTLIWPVHQIFDGLVTFDSALNVKPAIAKKWHISDDGLIYTFELRQDVFFHQHPLWHDKTERKVSAYDFVFSFNRILSPENSSPGVWIFSNIDKEFGENGFKAKNDSIFQLKLKKPFPPFIGMLGMQYCAVVPQKIVAHYSSKFGKHPIGTGPFYLKHWEENEKIILLKNKEYFITDTNGSRLPYLEAVNISFITDKQSEFMEFMLGNIDFISGLNSQYKDALLTRSGELKKNHFNHIKLQTAPYLNTEYLGFNLDSTKGQVVPLAVRKAINYCFDRSEMVRYLRNNMGYAAFQGFVPPTLTSNYPQKINGYSYDFQKAKMLLSDAGYSNGFPEPIELLTTSDYVDLCEYIQHKASKIGVQININLGTGASFRNKISQGEAQFFRGSWIADYPDPENYLSLFYSKNKSPDGPNYTRFNNKRFDLLYIEALLTKNELQKNELYKKMENIIIAQSPVVPLFYDRVVRFVRNDVKNLAPNALNLLDLRNVYKDE
jgi:peptide/nickel transport system substrate-binding protein